MGVFFFLFVFEVIIGGSGRVFEIAGGITLRKLTFPIALIISLLVFFYFKNIKKDIAFIFIIFFCLLCFSTILGFINYGNDERVLENFLYQSFLLLLPFYSFFINDSRDIKHVAQIIKVSALIMAAAYIILLFLLLFNVVAFGDVYSLTEDSPDFMARGESGFLYKGFLYLCLSLFFFENEKSLLGKRLKELFICTAIYFTYVRGFIVSIFLTLILHQFFFKSFVKGIFAVMAAFLIIAAFGNYYESASFDRYESDLIRKQQFEQVLSSVSPSSIFVGHGFGEGVAIRDNHMEVTYLEIFHKQGILGLLFWFSILGYIIIQYLECKRLGYEKEARPFLLATFFIYLQSATNPFLSNSIGLNMIIISIVCLSVYRTSGDLKLNFQR